MPTFNRISGDYDSETDTLYNVHSTYSENGSIHEQYGSMSSQEFLEMGIENGMTEIEEKNYEDGSDHFTMHY